MDALSPKKTSLDATAFASYGAAAGKMPRQIGNSALVTAGIIIADVVGAGVLSFANAIAHFGWLLGSVITVVCLAMNVHISLLLWRVCMECPRATTMPELAAEVFAKAPEDVRHLAVNSTAVVQYSFIMGMLGLYTLSFGMGYGSMFYDLRFCMPLWTGIGCCIMLVFFATGRSLGSWPSLIALNAATIVGTIVIPLVVMAHTGVHETRLHGAAFDAVSDLSIAGSLSGLSTMTFSMTGQFMLVEIIHEMKDPAEFPQAYTWISAPFQLAAFLSVGLGAYYYVGSHVNGMIVDNIPYGYAFRLAAFCLIVHMLVAFMIKAVVLARAAHRAIDVDSVDADDSRGWGRWALIAFSVTFCSWLLSQLVPFFEDFVELLGASLAPIGCWIIPIVLYARWLRDFGGADKSPSRFENCVIAAEFMFAMILLVFGTASSLVNIGDKWNTYGYPFACHCEDTWNTCECSPGHAGMEHCVAEGFAMPWQ